MNRRSFFSKFVAVAAGLLAIPKAMAGWKCFKTGSPICPNDPLAIQLDGKTITRMMQYPAIWSPHAQRLMFDENLDWAANSNLKLSPDGFWTVEDHASR